MPQEDVNCGYSSKVNAKERNSSQGRWGGDSYTIISVMLIHIHTYSSYPFTKVPGDIRQCSIADLHTHTENRNKDIGIRGCIRSAMHLPLSARINLLSDRISHHKNYAELHHKK